jgi:HK97 family phage major capsid protein
MRTEKELLETRARLVNEQNDLNNQLNGKDVTDEMSQRWDKIQLDIAALTAEIQRGQSVKQNMALIADQQAESEDRSGVAPKSADQKGAYRAAFDKWLRTGLGNMSTEERGIMSRGTDPQSVGTNNLGGFTVPQEFGDELIKAMSSYGGMLDVSTVIRTLSGAPMPFPSSDETSVTGQLVAENAPLAVKDIAFGSITLGSYAYTAGVVKLSYQLMQDNGINLEAEIMPILAERLGRIFNTHLTVGTGTGQPSGVVTGALAGVTSAAAAGVTRGEIIDLQHSVDAAYRANGRYMLNDLTIAALRKLSLGTGDASPLWQLSMREGAPDLLEGKPYTVNNDIATLGAGNVPLLFGDFSKYRVRITRDVTMAEMNELYLANLQKGFTAFARMDGALLDTKAVKKLTNAAS